MEKLIDDLFDALPKIGVFDDGTIGDYQAKRAAKVRDFIRTLTEENRVLKEEHAKMKKGLKRIDGMNCIQHLPSCSDIAYNVLASLSPN